MRASTSRRAVAVRKVSRREFCVAATVGGLAAVLTSSVSEATPSAPAIQPRWNRAKALDAVILDAVNSGHIVGATVIAAKNGEIVYRHAAG